MSDILDRMKEATIDPGGLKVGYLANLLADAIREIEQLRAVAGVVDALYSFREMRKEDKSHLWSPESGTSV